MKSNRVQHHTDNTPTYTPPKSATGWVCGHCGGTHCMDADYAVAVAREYAEQGKTPLHMAADAFRSLAENVQGTMEDSWELDSRVTQMEYEIFGVHAGAEDMAGEPLEARPSLGERIDELEMRLLMVETKLTDNEGVESLIAPGWVEQVPNQQLVRQLTNLTVVTLAPGQAELVAKFAQQVAEGTDERGAWYA